MCCLTIGFFCFDIVGNNLADGSSGIHLYESPQQTLVHTPKEDFFVQLQNAVAPHYLYPQFHTGPATIVVNDMNEFQRYQMVTAPGYPGKSPKKCESLIRLLD